jgi:hypothetical protein
VGFKKDEQENERSEETRRIEAEKQKDRFRQKEEDKETTRRIEESKKKEDHDT